MPPNFPHAHGDDEDDLRGPAFPGRPGGPAGPGMDFPAILHHLFSTVLNPNAVHGDAVYSQEALDRIITNLMEANPQSNAPPPASEDTIAKLPRKKLDEKMLGPELKGECTICIDDVGMGDEVIVLPCKHWFHDECVVLWLKEHNTCPICRAPVEGESAGQPQRNDETAGPEAGPSSSSRPSAAERRRSNLRQSARDRIDSIRAAGGLSDSRSASQRRSSNSPPMNPPSYQPSRVRSPSPSSRRSTFSERSSERSGEVVVAEVVVLCTGSETRSAGTIVPEIPALLTTVVVVRPLPRSLVLAQAEYIYHPPPVHLPTDMTL
ncbi:hypothetical protein PG997_008549 [Apiospora hydei]|uniref:RING-type domain-containing protein n=1 Tax=Apiospora hydei TaxID=1337664 RepID=A0ABR1WB54_9PEZI